MIDDNLEKWESKLIASEKRVLMASLVTEVSDLALVDDQMRVGCFRQTWLLMGYMPSRNAMTASNLRASRLRLLCLIRMKILILTLTLNFLLLHNRLNQNVKIGILMIRIFILTELARTKIQNMISLSKRMTCRATFVNGNLGWRRRCGVWWRSWILTVFF